MEQMEEEISTVDDLVMSFADDVAVFSGNDAIKPEIVHFFDINKGRTGLELNLPKCNTYDMMSVKEGEQSIPSLGSIIGTLQHRREFFVGKIDTVEAILQKLKQMPKQHAALLLRMSTANKLRHLLRCMDLRDLGPELQRIDELIYNMVDHLRALPDGEERGPHAEAITNWPTRLGGFGILGHSNTRDCAAQASTDASIRLLSEKGLITDQNMTDLAEQLTSEGVADADNRYLQYGPLPAPQDAPPGPSIKQGARVDAKMKVEMAAWYSNLTPEQQLQFTDNSDSLKWVLALPNAKWRSLTDKQIEASLNILMLRPKDEGPICPHCAQLNSIAHFELCAANNKVSAMTHYRHNCDRNCLATGANKVVGQVATIEPLVRDELPPPPPENNGAQGPPQRQEAPPPQHPVNIAAQAQPQHNPHFQNNAQRADVKVRMQGGVMEHSYCGLLDLASKVIGARHTEPARLQALNRATVA